MHLLKQTKEIFEMLSKGQFICSNSNEERKRKLYNVLEDRFEDLSEYFAVLNFKLEQGEEYFYFTREEAKPDIERKIEAAYRWIDIIDFLKTFDNNFGPGLHFTPADILVKQNVDVEIKNKLEGLKRHTHEDKQVESLNKILKWLDDNNFIELENEITNSYKVLSSFKYLELLILSINIPEEVKNEIPE
jgi:hypothetical protein